MLCAEMPIYWNDLCIIIFFFLMKRCGDSPELPLDGGMNEKVAHSRSL